MSERDHIIQFAKRYYARESHVGFLSVDSRAEVFGFVDVIFLRGLRVGHVVRVEIGQYQEIAAGRFKVPDIQVRRVRIDDDLAANQLGDLGWNRAGICHGILRGKLFPHSSGKNFLHDFTMHVRQPEIAALEAIRQLGVIETEQMQDRRVQVVDVDFVLDDVESKLVGLTD